MAWMLVALTVLWPVAQAAAVAATIYGSNSAGPAIVYLAGSRVCHQRADRSFHTAGVQWPVCARCSGLYVGAAFAACVGVSARLRRWTSGARGSAVLVVAGVPTLLTWVAEWIAGMPVTNAVRAIAAVPLGGAIAGLIVAVASPALKGIR